MDKKSLEAVPVLFPDASSHGRAIRCKRERECDKGSIGYDLSNGFFSISQYNKREKLPTENRLVFDWEPLLSAV